MKYYYPTKDSIDIVCIFMIAWGVFLAIYSYITQYQAIADTFTKEAGWNYDVSSIFTTKTVYGYMLLICSIFSVIYILNNKKYWMYVFPIFFLINMFISRSKTSILCLVILLICLLIYHISTNFNKHKKAWIISISSVLIVLTTLMILAITKVGIFDKFNYYLTQVIFNDASVVMQDRLSRWGNVFKTTDNPFLIIFGAGERISSTVLGVPTGDNIYVNTYATGGIIKFLLYILLIVFVMRYNIKTTKGGWNKFLVISIELIILIAGFFEDDALIGLTHTAIFDGIIMYTTPKLLEVNN